MSQIKKISNPNIKFDRLPRQVLIEDVHVYDPSEKIDEKLNVVLENGKISQLKKKKPANFSGKIISASGALGELDWTTNNNEARGTNQNTGDMLFDQILIPFRMHDQYVHAVSDALDVQSHHDLFLKHR